MWNKRQMLQEHVFKCNSKEKCSAIFNGTALELLYGVRGITWRLQYAAQHAEYSFPKHSRRFFFRRAKQKVAKLKRSAKHRDQISTAVNAFFHTDSSNHKTKNTKNRNLAARQQQFTSSGWCLYVSTTFCRTPFDSEFITKSKWKAMDILTRKMQFRRHCFFILILNFDVCH